MFGEQMEHSDPGTLSEHLSAVRLLQGITIGWMLIELSVSLFAGIRARSVALTSFGADSGIELFSAVIVLRRFGGGPKAEERAARFAGVLLYALAAYILGSSILSIFALKFRPEASPLGVGLLVAAAIVMPLLGKAKRKLAIEIDSKALNADAAQSTICAYMSWIALAGLWANMLLRIPWADSVAALCLLPLVITEANEARKGKPCDC